MSIFICPCSSFCCCIFIWFPGYFAVLSALHPGFSGLWRSLPALSSTPTTFDCLFVFIYCERYGFEWAFFTHRHFLPYAPSQHFWHNLLLSRLLWEPQKHRSDASVCLIHSNPQSFIHFKFVLMHVNIAKVLLVMKTLIKNIDQQPHYSAAMQI